MSGRRRAYPPAWYRDPVTTRQLRRWNGWRWTAETREYPSWLLEVPVAVGPPRRSAARLLWTGAVVCALAAIASLVAPQGTVTADRIRTASFVDQADALCKVTVEHFGTTDDDHPDRATRMRARADAWAVMVASLRDLEVDPRDRPIRDRWLAAWDHWIVEGRAYAAALASGDGQAAETASIRSEPSKRVIDRTAIASGMPACRFAD